MLFYFSSLLHLPVVASSGGGDAAGDDGAGRVGAQEANQNAALTTVQTNIQTALTNIGGDVGALVKAQEGEDEDEEGDDDEGDDDDIDDDDDEDEDSDDSDEDADIEESCTETNDGETCTYSCSGGGSVSYTWSAVDEITFNTVVEYSDCETEACGETVTINGGFEFQQVYDEGIFTGTVTTGACGSGGITATSGGSDTSIDFTLEITYDFTMETADPQISGEFCTNGESQTINSWDDLESTECREGEHEGTCAEACDGDSDCETACETEATTFGDCYDTCYNENCISLDDDEIEECLDECEDTCEEEAEADEEGDDEEGDNCEIASCSDTFMCQTASEDELDDELTTANAACFEGCCAVGCEDSETCRDTFGAVGGYAASGGNVGEEPSCDADTRLCMVDCTTADDEDGCAAFVVGEGGSCDEDNLCTFAPFETDN